MSPKVRFRKDRKVWEADYYDAYGKRHRVTAPTKSAASAKYEDAIADKKKVEQKLRGQVRFRVERHVTIKDYANRWLADMDVAEETEVTTRRIYRQTLRLYVLPQFATLKVDRIQDIKARSVKDAFLLLKEKGFSGNTICRARSVLRQLLSSAVEDEIIPNNPVLEIRRTRSKGKMRRVRAMSSEQREKFLSAMHEKNLVAFAYRAAFQLAFMTGARPGEVWALQTSDVDLERRKLRIERSKEILTNRVKDTKTHEQRDVDLNPETVEMMRSYLARRRKWCLGNGHDVDWLFLNEAGGLIDHNGAVKRFKRVLKAARLPHFSPYCTRHTYATLLLERHAPLTYVSKQLGHANPTTTLRYYAHWLPVEDPGYVERLERGWNQTGTKVESNPRRELKQTGTKVEPDPLIMLRPLEFDPETYKQIDSILQNQPCETPLVDETS